MTKIYFIRHSKVELVEDNLSRPLSIEGKELLDELEGYFKNINVDTFISSPYHRAINTIKGIANDKNKDIEIIEDLKERTITNYWIEDFRSFAMAQWNDFDYKLSHGESLRESQTRAIKVINNIIREHKDETIIIGTHGTLLATIINYYDNSFGYDDWSKIKMPDIFLFTYDNDKLENIERVNYKLVRN